MGGIHSSDSCNQKSAFSNTTIKSHRAMDHEQLIEEFRRIQLLPNEERMQLAVRKRQQQLSRYQKQQQCSSPRRRGSGRDLRPAASTVRFSDSVVLQEAAARGDLEEVERLLISGVDPNAANEDGLTALHQSCIDNDEDMMSLLLNHGAAIDARDCELWTPLHAAAICGHVNIVSSLILRGADLLALNIDGNMPYDICDCTVLELFENQMALRSITHEQIDEARGEREKRMLEDIRTRPASCLEERGYYQETPMHVAAANNYVAVLELLIDRGAAVNLADVDNWLPVHAAACWGNMDALEILFHNGGDIEAVTFSGETVADLCEHPTMQERVCEMLVELEDRRQQKCFDNSSVSSIPRNYQRRSTRRCVRRLSMKERSLTKKEDARQEVEIRQSLGECDFADINTILSGEAVEFSPSAQFASVSSEAESVQSTHRSGSLPSPTASSPESPAELPLSQPRASSSSNAAQTDNNAVLTSNREYADQVVSPIGSEMDGDEDTRLESEFGNTHYVGIENSTLSSNRSLSLSELKLCRKMNRCQKLALSGIGTPGEDAKSGLRSDSTSQHPAIVDGPRHVFSDDQSQIKFSSERWYKCCCLL